MRKFSLFNFMEQKIEDSEITAIVDKMMNELSFKELALHIGVSYIANTISKCEFQTFENGVEVKDKLYYMLNVSPNPNENSSQFINRFVENYYYQGHSLIVPIKDNLYVADSFHLEDNDPTKEYIFQDIIFNNYQHKNKYKSKDVFYMKLDNKNVKMLIDSVYAQYGEIMALTLSSYKRTNGKRYKLVLDQIEAGNPKFKEQYETVIKKQLETFMKNDNAIYTQYRGYDLQDFSSKTPQDTTDIITMRKEIFEVVAQALKIPLSMLFGNITNMNEIVKVYLSICIDPLADMIGEELTRKYHGFEGWKNGNYIKVDTSCINHVDILDVSNGIYNAIGSGAVNIDDMRRRLNLPTLDTVFSTSHFVTKNYVPADDMLNSIEEEGGER